MPGSCYRRGVPSSVDCARAACAVVPVWLSGCRPWHPPLSCRLHGIISDNKPTTAGHWRALRASCPNLALLAGYTHAEYQIALDTANPTLPTGLRGPWLLRSPFAGSWALRAPPLLAPPLAIPRHAAHVQRDPLVAWPRAPLVTPRRWTPRRRPFFFSFAQCLPRALPTTQLRGRKNLDLPQLPSNCSPPGAVSPATVHRTYALRPRGRGSFASAIPASFSRTRTSNVRLICVSRTLVQGSV